jgi:hypothetical protein
MPNVTVKERLKTYWSYKCGVEQTPTYGDLLKYGKTWTERSVQHRAYPNPLTNTPQANVYTMVHTYGRSLQSIIVDEKCDGQMSYGTNQRYYRRLEDVPLNALIPLGFDQEKWNTKYLNALRELSADASGLLAEIDETANLIHTFANITLDIISCMYNPWMCTKALKHIRKFATWKSIPSAVLLNNFAIQPGVNSLYDITEKLKDPNYSLDRKVEFRVTQTDNISGPYWNARRKLICNTKLNVRLRDDGFLSRVNFGNPLEWAWERIPFSFVIDWVLPVGGFVQAIGTLSRIESSYGTRSIRQYVNAENFKSQWDPVYVVEKHARATYVSHRRDIVGIAALPDVFQVARSKSLTRLASAVSLLTLLRSRN